MDLTAIGAYISLLRRQRGLSQRELASRLGVSCQAVSKLENAENLPDAALLLPLAEELHTTADALLSAGATRLRQPVDLNRLQGGIAALAAALDAFGEEFAVTEAIRSALAAMGVSLAASSDREKLLAEAILSRLLAGETITDAALEAAIHDEALLKRIRKCRCDCALFSGKQQIYEDCRPGWPEEAVRFIREKAGEGAAIADLGSGTGKLAALCAPWAGRVYAIEPGAHMRRMLRERTQALGQVQVIAAAAEFTGLPAQSVDAVTIAEAYHWFDNDDARAEIRRILRPGGYVFLLWNRFRGNPFDGEMADLNARYRPVSSPPRRTGDERADALYGEKRWLRLEFDNTIRQSPSRFLGGMCSASFVLEAGTVAGEAFRREARELFGRYASGGLLTTCVTTVLYAGQLPE